MVDIDTLREQVDRMNQIVSYQLQKASNVAGAKINKPIDMVPIISKILSALGKVYREKSVKFRLDLPEQIMLRMDESDCLEIIGNLLDNAFKYSEGRVEVLASMLNENEMELRIDDNGTGLEQDEVQQILSRGTRLDQSNEGQGIGLAVVADIVRSYNIEMKFDRSELGGLRVKLILQIA